MKSVYIYIYIYIYIQIYLLNGRKRMKLAKMKNLSQLV